MKKFDDKVLAARRLGILLHENQRYSETEPYEEHLYHVYRILVQHDILDKDILAAAWLHDAMEDTGVSKAVIEELLGSRVAELVNAVSDEPGVNRKEWKAKTYPKIRAVERATTLKLADRLANVEHAVLAKNLRMFKMYKKEMETFSAELRGKSPENADKLWFSLDNLLKVEPQMVERGIQVPAEI